MADEDIIKNYNGQKTITIKKHTRDDGKSGALLKFNGTFNNMTDFLMTEEEAEKLIRALQKVFPKLAGEVAEDDYEQLIAAYKD